MKCFWTVKTFLIVIIIGIKVTSAQIKPFLLEISVSGAEEGEVLRLASDYKDTLNLYLANDTDTLKQGKVTFRGKLINPHAFHIYCDDSLRYISTDIFFIEPGNFKATFHIDSIDGKNVIINGSKTNEDYLQNFHSDVFQKKLDEWYDKVYKVPRLITEKKRDSILSYLTKLKTKIYHERDSTLYEDSKFYPNSVVPIWMIFRFLHQKGFSSYYDSILKGNKLPLIATQKALKEKLEIASKVSVGSQFPKMNLSTIEDYSIKTNFVNKQNTYSLIDFWYSHCGPCIAQFPQLKNIYFRYHSKGFEIYGVSIDSKKYSDDWKAVIKKHQINWKQYLDISGVEAGRYEINFFPYNFLLNKSGKIVAKNISPSELQKYLYNNIVH